MKGHVRSSLNYVNLGKFYSVPPWSDPFRTQPPLIPRNHVNLGRLYEHTFVSKKWPPGWAYFHDGSVFVAPAESMDHEAFETRMRTVEHFVREPSPALLAIRQDNPSRKRLIVIGQGRFLPGHTSLRLLARNAQDGERSSIAAQRFEKVVIAQDETEGLPLSGGRKITPPLNMECRQGQYIQQALQTFRGTLVDGILQPNVKLGNGLLLALEPYPSNSVKPQKKDTGAHEEREIIRTQEEILEKWRSPSLDKTHEGRTSDCDPAAPDALFAAKVAMLEAKERELQYREEILRWKRKTWWLEQRLKSAGDQAPRSHARYRPNSRTPPHGSTESYDSFDEAQYSHDEQHDPFDDQDLRSYVPPRQGMRVPSRTFEEEHESFDDKENSSDDRYISSTHQQHTVESEAADDVFDSSHLDDSTPSQQPQSPAHHARIALPTRRTLLSQRFPD
ncbi:hypothetical protein BKA63DRAFT_563550 [Paraphoma chrysanthemicola]|nr:hypothetical protein BKA63DRAFT_563550 [Paraphoma chrysanthemicola]